MKLNSEGAEKLSTLTKKYEGSFLRVRFNYDDAYTLDNLTHLTDGILCIDKITNEREANDIVDIFTKPYFNLYSSGTKIIKKASSE